MYALAAGAAGVGVLALTQPAEAKIVYTPANVHIGVGKHYHLDLNHDGATDFTIAQSEHRRSCQTGGYSRGDLLDVRPSPVRSNGIESTRSFHFAAALLLEDWRPAPI
jgi:hypothetical protein